MRGARAATGRPAVWWLDMMGRLKPGWTLQQAQAHLAGLSRGIFEATAPPPPAYTAEMANHYRGFTFTAADASRGVSNLRTQYSTHLWLLLGATGLVLLITCANLASLMVARATARQREIAVRLAIGASRQRVVRQMLAESVLIAGAAGLLGVVLANWLSRTLVSLLGTAGSIVLDLTPDWRMVAFMMLVAAVACALFGVGPALRATNNDPARALQGAGRSNTDGRETLGFRRGLVIVQVALSMVLLVSALLFTRSLQNLTSVDLGFRPDVLAAGVDLGRSSIPADRREQAAADILGAIRSVPGIVMASEAFIVPLSGPEWDAPITIRGAAQNGTVYFNSVGTDYFRTLEMPVLGGRAFDARDRQDSPRVAVVSETFVKRFFAGTDPLGQTFHVGPPGGAPQPPIEIVGVVRDARYGDVREDPLPVAHFPIVQEPNVPTLLGVVLRSDLPYGSVTPALTRAITAAAPGAGVSYTPMAQYIEEQLRTDRLMTTLAGLFGMLALIISVVGLYGVMSYMVTRRRVEIGIRMALGAEPGTIVGMMLAESGVLLAVGGAAGIVLAVVACRYAAQLLYGVSAADPASFALAMGALATVGLLASWIPARRAARVAPTAALRD